MMQKTRLGISVGMLGAAIYFTGLFGGYLITVILTGYVLLFEENSWLRKSGVKAVTLIVFFSFLITIINLIPDALSVIGGIATVFKGNFNYSVLNQIISVIVDVIDIIEKILLLGLGVKSLEQGNIAVPVVDKLVNKYMG